MSNFFSGDFFQDTFMFSFTVAFVSDLVPFSRYTLLFFFMEFLWDSWRFVWDFYGISMGCLYGISLVFLCDGYGTSLRFLCNFGGVSMGCLCHFYVSDFYEISMEFPRDFYGISVGLLWNFYSIFLQCR